MSLLAARSECPFDMEEAASSLKSYAESTGIHAFAINERGEMLLSSNNSLHMTEFCHFFQSFKGGRDCQALHLDASLYSYRIGDVYIYNCAAGLTHWTVPLVSNKKFIGALVAGPVLMMEADDYLIGEIKAQGKIPEEHMETMEAHLREIPVVDRKKVVKLAKLLFIMGNYLNKHESELLEDRKSFYEQQARLSEEIQAIKEKELENKGITAQDHFLQYFPLEKELTKKVRFGDKIGAKAVLNEILGQIFFFNGGNMELIKARLMELVVVLSRAAVEGGAEIEMILGMNLNFLEAFTETKNVEEMSYLLIKILDRFIDHVFNLGNTKNYKVIQKAIEFIRCNYSRDITLEDTAKSVNLSPSYFCSIFKDEMRMNFTDYLNRVRVEESKKLLLDLSISLFGVAQEVGFNDQSYFSKVFKKLEGISPGQFRKNGRIN